MEKSVDAGKLMARKQPLLLRLKKESSLIVMLIPVTIGFALFSYLPIYGIIIAFKDYDLIDGIAASPWVGFDNFARFIEDPFFFRVIRNTVLLGVYKLLWGFGFPIVFALFLNELKNRIFKRTVQSVAYLPHFLSMVVIVGILHTLFATNGLINQIVMWLGGEQVNFLADPAWFRTMYVASAIWQELGWESIIYLAAMASINSELYEAANIDGAGRFQKMWHVTLPSIRPAIMILLIFAVSDLIGIGFEKVYLMYSPAVYETADVLQTYVYRRGIVGGDFSYAAAIGLFNSAVSFILLFAANYISRKTSETSLW